MDTGCSELNKAGEPCSATHFKDGYCRWHHPDLAEQRRAERAAGGVARSNRARAKKQMAGQVMTIGDLDALLCSALTKVSEGTMEPGVGSSMAGIARTITTIRTASDLERRIEELEQAAGIGTVRRIGS